MATKKEESQELAKSETVSLEEFMTNKNVDTQGIFDVNDNIKGVKGRIPTIQIVHKAEQFKFQDGSKVSSFKGILLHHSPANAFWDKTYDQTGGGVPPTCSSSTGECPNSGEKIQSKYCFDCPHNQFGSGKEGKGKACKNMWRLHIIIENQQIPKRLTLPPSNTGALQDFLIYLRDINLPHELAILEFSLVPTSNKSGIEYSMINIKPVGVITDRAKALSLKKMKDDFKDAFGEVIDVDETIIQQEDVEVGNKL